MVTARHRAGPAWRWFVVAVATILAGLALAAWTQTRGGVSVRDIRFHSPDGTTMSALLYRPANATPGTPAPGILAVHGYLNTRETQSAFAIEFARRGYVVLALDQRGHGYSGGIARADGYGGPEGLAYLRSLPFVNRDQIGLEGHSMGGWTVLAAAAAYPDGYRAMVLEGSTTGAPFAAEGTSAWPRNVAVVFSRFDEFAPLMWAVPRAGDVGGSPKMKALFGTDEPVAPGRLYGDLAAGTARLLRQPSVTHPGDHLSTEAVGEAIAWFSRTLQGGRPIPPGDQIWWGKEAGTGLALLGLALLALALADLLLRRPAFAALQAAPIEGAAPMSGARWWTLFLLTAFVPAVTFLVALLVLPPPILPSRLFPQAVNNWLMVWAVGNALLALLIGRFLAPSSNGPSQDWRRSALLAATVIAILYGAVAAAALIPLDFRFWVVALKPLALRQVPAFLAYLVPFTFFVAVAFRGLGALIATGRTAAARAGIAAAALAGGFAVLTGVQYLFLFATGRLPLAVEALNAIVALQFVPVLAGLGVLATWVQDRTGRWLPGALIGGLFVTWYVVAGTASHVAP